MKKGLLLISISIFFFSCGPSETAKNAAGELCECLDGVTVDLTDANSLLDAGSCLQIMMKNEDYQNLSEKSVTKVMKDECPEAHKTFEALMEMGKEMM